MKQPPSKIMLMLTLSLFLVGNGAITPDYQELNGRVSVSIIQENTLLSISPPPQLQEIYRTYATLTAYNSIPEQTDSTPFITASGQRTRDGIVASNWLDFGQIIEFDGRYYEVQDRMHERYGYPYLDIWMEDLEEAQDFGVIRTTVKVVE